MNVDKAYLNVLTSHATHFRLGEVGSFQRGSGIQKADLSSEGIPAIHYGQIHTAYGIWTDSTLSFVAEALGARSRLADTGNLIIATTSEDDEAVGKATAWLGPEKVAVSGDAVIYRHELDPRYMSYFFASSSFQLQKRRYITGAKVRRLSPDALAKIIVPVPDLEIQQKIVRILDRFTQLEAELEAELEARRVQYAYYRDQLLTFSERERERVRWLRMSDIALRNSGINITAARMRELHREGGPVRIFAGGQTFADVPVGVVPESQVIRNPSIIVRSRGIIDFAFYKLPFSHKNEIWSYTVTESRVHDRYVFHYLKTQTHRLQEIARSKSVKLPQLSVGDTDTLMVPLPSLNEQRRIADTLDKFDVLVNDLSSGLPAEIAARRKQYEYYRDKLLTFEEVLA